MRVSKTSARAEVDGARVEPLQSLLSNDVTRHHAVGKSEVATRGFQKHANAVVACIRTKTNATCQKHSDTIQLHQCIYNDMQASRARSAYGFAALIGFRA